MSVPRKRPPHRVAWAIAGIAVIVAASVAILRESAQPVTAPPPDLETLKVEMFDRLASDPNAWQTRTRAAVERVAALAETEEIRTAEARYALALRLAGEGRLAESEAAYRETIALRPGWARPHNGLGIVLYRQGRTEDAVAAFEQAKALEPEWSRPYNDLALLLRTSGRFEEAREMAEMALALSPESVAAHNNFGNLLKEMGDLEGAEAAYRRAIERDPNHPSPRYNLACVYSLRRDVDRAIAYLQEAIAQEPAFRDEARRDPDFDPIRETLPFIAIVGVDSGDRGRG